MTTSSFKDALCFWDSDQVASGNFLDHWFATGNTLPNEHFFFTARTLLLDWVHREEAFQRRAAGLRVSRDAQLSEWKRREREFLQLQTFLSQLDDRETIRKLCPIVEARYSMHASEAQESLPRVVAQLRAMLHGVLSAYFFCRFQAAKGDAELQEQEFAEFCRQSIACIRGYRRAMVHKSWDWRGEKFPWGNPDPAFRNLGREETPFARLANHLQREPSIALSTSAMLMWQRLMAYLLADNQEPLVVPQLSDGTFAAPVEYQSQGQALWAVVNSDSEGEVSPVVVQLRSEGPEVFYWDPVALGMMILDRPLLGSVQNAWKLLENTTDWKKETAHTLRISLVRTPEVWEFPRLGGASAGALVGCTMYAAVHRMLLNQDASVTAVVLNDSGELGAIRGLVSKLKAAKTHRIKTVVVAADQKNGVDERERVESIHQLVKGVAIYEERSIADAIVHLLGDHGCEEALRKYANCNLNEWNLLTINANNDERLDHFVEQRYSLLAAGVTPFQRIEAQARRQQSPDGDDVSESRFNYQDVGGEGDVALAHLLKDAPWLLLCEDAGAGKTVFTLRALAWLSLPSTWTVLSGGKPLLAIRWERSWPTLDQELSIDRFDDKVAETIAQVVGRKKDEMLPVARYARTHHRLCLILDAMDQAEVAQIANLEKFTAEMAERSSSDIHALAGAAEPETGGRVPVRLIVTSRIYKIQEFSPFKDGSRWRFGKVELFNEEQRRRYLADLPVELIQKLIPDELLNASTEDDNDEDASDPSLFAFPEVLRLIRVLIEKSSSTGEELTLIRNRADLYELVSSLLVHRALEKLPADLQQRHRRNDEQEGRLREMLAALAFTLQLAECLQGEVPVGQSFVKEIKRRAKSICSEETRSQWDHDYELMERTEFTDRCGISGDGQKALGFRTRKTMEFHAAVHLARYANDPTAEVATSDLMRAWRNERNFDNLTIDTNPKRHRGQPSPPDQHHRGEATGLAGASGSYAPIVLATDGSDTTRSANNSDTWKVVWLLALELAENESEHQVQPTVRNLCSSLEFLFERPAGGRRPTELMYRAWVLFKNHRSLTKAGKKILERFQQEAVEMLHDDRLWPEPIPRGEPNQKMEYVTWTVAQLAATLIPEYRVQELITDEKERGHITAERWKKIAPPGWGWFLPESEISNLKSQFSDLHSLALAQLQAWKDAGYREEWEDSVTGQTNVFRYEDRAFVPCPPVDFAELLEQSLSEEHDKTGFPIWSDDEIRERVAVIRQAPLSYWRGSHDADSEADEADGDDQPRHRVQFTRPFWVQTTAVTRSQLALFDPAIGNQKQQDMLASDCPAGNVCWWDGALFALFLESLVPGCGLPSEAQWEYAARAGRDFAGLVGRRGRSESSRRRRRRRFERFGIPPYDTLSPSKANILSYGSVSLTLPVRWNGERRMMAFAEQLALSPQENKLPPPFPSNLWGVWQAHGNNWEWCQDNYHWDTYQAFKIEQAVDPVFFSEDPAADRVARGGSRIRQALFLDVPSSANRSGFAPDDAGSSAGCRLCVCAFDAKTP